MIALLLAFELFLQDVSQLKEPLPIENCSVSGFLYKSEQNNYILSSETNLKSCCIGSLNKKNSQILCKGSLEDALGKGLVRLEGTLDKEEECLTLKDCRVHKKRNFPLRSFLIASLAIALLIYKKKSSKYLGLLKNKIKK
jgi:hypothetical protein